MGRRAINVIVNGEERQAEAEDRAALSDLLRQGLGLTGTHVGCEQGVCGTCTVLVEGEPVRSCLMLAAQAEGCHVETVEGLAPEGRLTALQESLMTEHGLQCGFCTPGVLMSLTYADRAGLSETETIEEILAGHLCRCTGYGGIRTAVARHWRSGGEDQ